MASKKVFGEWRKVPAESGHFNYEVSVDKNMTVYVSPSYASDDNNLWMISGGVRYRLIRSVYQTDDWPLIWPDWASSEQERVSREQEIIEKAKEKALKLAMDWIDGWISDMESSKLSLSQVR